jgi:hypothetical protein
LENWITDLTDETDFRGSTNPLIHLLTACQGLIEGLNWLVKLEAPGDWAMQLHELVVEMKILERRLASYEEKYGILSEDFYNALMSGQFEEYDEYDETRIDFSRWKGIYETWQRRKEKYDAQLKELDITESLRFQPAY